VRGLREKIGGFEMTHRGPFQPRAFCDSVIRSVKGGGIVWESRVWEREEASFGRASQFPGLLVALRFVFVSASEDRGLSVCFGKALCLVGCASKRKMWRIT